MRVVGAIIQIVIAAAIVAIVSAPFVIALSSCGCATQVAHEIASPDQQSHNVTESQPVSTDADSAIVQAGKRVVSALVSIGGGDKQVSADHFVIGLLAGMWFLQWLRCGAIERRSHKRAIERIRNGTGA